MKKSMMWWLSVAALLLVLCWTVSGQAEESNDLSSEATGNPQAQAAPAYTAQATSCPTASYTVEDGDTYSFEDISATGTPLNMVDDVEVDIPIGFATGTRGSRLLGRITALPSRPRRRGHVRDGDALR